jgi:hypothetical protein
MRGHRWGAIALVSVVLVAGCGGGDSKVSASSLNPRLLPSSSLPGFRLERKLDLSDPVNLVGEGIALPEATHPSAAVKEFESAGVQGASGEVFKQGGGLDATEVHIGTARFGSGGNADKVRKWMHGQDLQQPCFSQCAFSPRPTRLPGVPNSAAVVQVATAPPAAPGVVAPANYRAEFTSGPYLYWVWFRGDASAKTKAEFVAGLKLYYRHAKQQPA